MLTQIDYPQTQFCQPCQQIILHIAFFQFKIRLLYATYSGMILILKEQGISSNGLSTGMAGKWCGRRAN
jgi:hypothetical protein